MEEFYGKLQELIEQVSKGDVLIIIGDWNAKIGEAGAPGIVGKHGIGNQNEPGGECWSSVGRMST